MVTEGAPASGGKSGARPVATAYAKLGIMVRAMAKVGVRTAEG